jgi:hypothetical protein
LEDILVSEQLGKVDHSSLRVNQAVIILALLTAYIFDLPWLTAAVALIMLVGTGIVKQHVLADNPKPHRFAQGIGDVVAAVSSALLFLGASAAGWALVWLVIVLSALNLFVGFCAGCAVYYWLQRLQVPGFLKSPPAGTFPGMRPRA